MRKMVSWRIGNLSSQQQKMIDDWLDRQANIQGSLTSLVLHAIDWYGYQDVLEHQIQKDLYKRTPRSSQIKQQVTDQEVMRQEGEEKQTKILVGTGDETGNEVSESDSYIQQEEKGDDEGSKEESQIEVKQDREEMEMEKEGEDEMEQKQTISLSDVKDEVKQEIIQESPNTELDEIEKRKQEFINRNRDIL